MAAHLDYITTEVGWDNTDEKAEYGTQLAPRQESNKVLTVCPHVLSSPCCYSWLHEKLARSQRDLASLHLLLEAWRSVCIDACPCAPDACLVSLMIIESPR